MNKLRFRFMSSESWSTFCKIKRTLILCNSSRNNVWQKFISELQLLVVHINFVPLLNSISFISSVLANKSLWFTALSPFVYLPFVSFFFVCVNTEFCLLLSLSCFKSSQTDYLSQHLCFNTFHCESPRTHLSHCMKPNNNVSECYNLFLSIVSALWNGALLCFALIH